MYGAAQGRALQGAGQDIERLGGLIEQRQTQAEINKLNAEFAKAQAELTVDWQETLRTADPNDPNVANDWRNNVLKARVDSLGSLAKTREAKAQYERMAAGLNGTFLVSTEAGRVHLAETAAVESFTSTINQMSDAVSADPTSFESSLAGLDIATEGYVRAYGLSREQALKMGSDARADLAFAAARGGIDKNPELGRQEVEAGRYSEYITPQQKAQLLNYADGVEASRMAAQKRALEQADQKAQVDWMRSISDGSFDYAQMVRDDRLQPESMRALAGAFRAAQDGAGGKEGMQDYNFQQDFQAALNGDITDTRAILNRVGAGAYPMSRANEIIDVIQGNATPEGQARAQVLSNFEKTAAARFVSEDPMIGYTDPEGRASLTRFMLGVNADLRKRREQGLPGLEDPTVLNSYLDRLEQYAPSPAEVLQRRMDAAQRFADEEKARRSGKRATPKYQSIQEYEASKAKGE